ncbi:MAG: hypothetical protein NTZ14_12050, partial [Hyphomicrobiales bacterium]|nr:hypothetical protein [Hyphomicrobiales bacterium]
PLQGPGLSRFMPHSTPVADFYAAPLAGNCAAIDTPAPLKLSADGYAAEKSVFSEYWLWTRPGPLPAPAHPASRHYRPRRSLPNSQAFNTGWHIQYWMA